MKFLRLLSLVIFTVLTHGNANEKSSDLLLMINDSYAQYRGSAFKIIDQNNSLLISSDKKSVRLIDLVSLLPYREYIGYASDSIKGSVECADVNPDKTIVATGGSFSLSGKNNDDEKSNIRIYDFKTAKLIKILPQYQIPTKLKFSDDGTLLVASSMNKIFIWNVKTFTLIKMLEFENSLLDFELDKENNSSTIFFTLKNDKIIKYSIELDKYLATFKTNSNQKICINSNYIISIGSNDNSELAVFDHSLNLLKYFIIIPDMTQKSGFKFKEISSIVKLNKNEMTTNTLIYSQKPLQIKDIALNEKYLYLLANNIQFTVDTKLNWPIVDFQKDLNYSFYTIKTGADQSLFLQDKKGFIYSQYSIQNNIKNTFGNERDVIENIFKTKFLGLSLAYNDYEVSDYIDGGYAFSIKELAFLMGKAGKRIVSGNGNFDVKIESDGVAFLFKDAMYNSVIKTEDYSTFGFMNDQIAMGYKNGNLKLFNLLGETLSEIKIHNNPIETIYYSKNYLVSIDSNNIAKVWDISKQSFICSIFIDKQNEFVTWTQEGYFTVSSPKALKYISWHMNRGYDKEAYRYDLSKFYDVFFRPDLVKLKLQGKDITPYTGGLTAQDALKNPPPSPKIIAVDDTNQHLIDSDKPMQVATKQEKVKVKFSIADEGGGVGSIRIYQEGKLIQTIGSYEITKVTANVDSKLAEKSFEESRKSSSLLALAKAVNKEELTFEDRVGRVDAQQLRNQAGTYEAEVSLKEGSNQISIEAFNSTNTITSYQASIDIKAEIPKKPSKLYAIVAGVNNFDASYIPALKYAVGDAKAIADEMFKAKKTIYDDVEVIYITDKKVTKESIYDAFKNVQKKASVNDTVVFYISTHGVSANGTFYLFPSNNADAGQFIDFSDLFKMSSSMKALSQVFIVDACQSGGAVDIASSVYDSRASVMARSAGIHLLSASTSGTSAFENEKAGHGVFTNEILASLKNPFNDTNKDGFVSIIEVSNNLIKRQQEEENNAQMPVIRNVGNDIFVKKIK